ncbi:MAG: sugar phosphate nucleotidyltransferase [Longimicrobiales bacterium]
MHTTMAVILARGVGTRMRRVDAEAGVTAEQSDVANTGVKGMIPTATGAPFLDYVISGLADAGIADVCLVIGPEHSMVRDYYSRVVTRRVRIHFAIQQDPIGTANAVLAAESFADGNTVIVLNSDNYYPVHTLRGLCDLGTNGVAAFERNALVRLGNIDAGRVAKYSLLEIAEDGTLARIVEKPDPAFMQSSNAHAFVGMNSWSLTPVMFEACRRVPPSPRGEQELPLAAQFAIDHMGVRFQVLQYQDGVLDLSHRADIPAVAAALTGIAPHL